MNQPAAIVVVETTPRWAPELQRQLEGEPFMVRACRTAADFRNRLQATQSAGTPCIGLIDLTIGLSSALTLVAWLHARNAVASVVIGNSQAITLEPALRELGATAVHVDSISGFRLAAECRRFASVGLTLPQVSG